jgi:YfiH family protein
MIEKEANGLKYFQFHSFADEGMFHGVFSRIGGASLSPYASLNLGGTTGDSKENVIENRKRVFDIFHRDVDTVYDVWQVHGNKVISTDTPRPLNTPHQQADAILTNSTKVTLLMRFADCVPILVFDPGKKVVGIAHAGWQGTIKKVAQTIIIKMTEIYGCRPQDVYTGIGPSIGPDHYVVGQNVIDQVKDNLPNFADEVLLSKNGKTILDLWKTNTLLLQEAGVRNIEVAGICTSCNIQDWFSYRMEGPASGRFAVVIGLNE